MALTHGQLDHRAERIRKTSEWLGAAPMTDFGEVVREDYADFEVNPEVVQQLVQQIRIGLASGHGCVRVGERHRQTCIEVVNLLSPEERKHVIFDLDNIMPTEPAEQSEVIETAPEMPPGSVRDIIRPKPPNVIRVEDGSLRPLQ